MITLHDDPRPTIILQLKEVIERAFRDPASRLAFCFAVADDALSDAHLSREEAANQWVLAGKLYDKGGDAQ